MTKSIFLAIVATFSILATVSGSPISIQSNPGSGLQMDPAISHYPASRFRRALLPPQHHHPIIHSSGAGGMHGYAAHVFNVHPIRGKPFTGKYITYSLYKGRRGRAHGGKRHRF